MEGAGGCPTPCKRGKTVQTKCLGNMSGDMSGGMSGCGGGIESETDEEDDEVDKQCVGESVVDAPVRELGSVDVVAVAVTVFHHRRRSSLDVVSVLLPYSHHDVTHVSLLQTLQQHSSYQVLELVYIGNHRSLI